MTRSTLRYDDLTDFFNKTSDGSGLDIEGASDKPKKPKKAKAAKVEAELPGFVTIRTTDYAELYAMKKEIRAKYLFWLRVVDFALFLFRLVLNFIFAVIVTFVILSVFWVGAILMPYMTYTYFETIPFIH